MTVSERSKTLVKEFFLNLEQGDAKAVAALFTEDGVHINPYASGLFPEGTSGREAIENYWQGPIENFDSMSFPIEELFAMEGISMVFVKFSGNIVLPENAGVYSNDYYATF